MSNEQRLRRLEIQYQKDLEQGLIHEIRRVINEGPIGHYSPGTNMDDDAKKIMEINTLLKMYDSRVIENRS